MENKRFFIIGEHFASEEAETHSLGVRPTEELWDLKERSEQQFEDLGGGPGCPLPPDCRRIVTERVVTDVDIEMREAGLPQD